MPSARSRLFAFVLGLAWLVTSTLPAQAPADKQPVKLKVFLPHAKAELKVDDAQPKGTGVERRFVSPPLDPAKQYTYKLTTVWRPNNYTTITRTRDFNVRPGKEIEIDLRKADDKIPDRIVIRYVPTPPEVVEAMLKLANVGKDDIVYDLGCGDGRIVITAASKFSARRGVGVDLDPERIAESKAGAKTEKVEDRVEFRQGDVLDIKDLSAATVVTLYMSDDLNLALRPILQKTLKPGARIVSHRFTMGDWKPLKTEKLTDGEGEEYLIHLWKIGE